MFFAMESRYIGKGMDGLPILALIQRRRTEHMIPFWREEALSFL